MRGALSQPSLHEDRWRENILQRYARTEKNKKAIIMICKRAQDLQWYFAWLRKVLIRENTSMSFRVKLNDHFNGCAFF